MKDETKYALISDAVYQRGPANSALNIPSIVPGASRGAVSDIPSNGFYAEEWTVDGKTVIAFRGTDFAAPLNGDFDDANYPLAQANAPSAQLSAAIAFVDQIMSRPGFDVSKLVFTGHSLGGGLAGLMAAKYGQPAFVYAPAPFKATSELATFIPSSLTAAQVTLLQGGPPVPPSGPNGPDLSDPTYVADKARYDAAKAARDTQVGNNYQNIKSYGLVDEVLRAFLQDGPFGWMAGKYGINHFEPLDVSFNVGGGSVWAEALAKHSMSLHALLLRTNSGTIATNDETGWISRPIGGVDGLLTKDASLRGAFLNTPAITGPLNTQTRDNTSTDPDPGIMLRALVSDLNFYTQFHTRFGSWLSAGAVGKDISGTADSFSFHSGVVKLGLQVVRDALTKAGSGPVVGSKGLNVFGEDPATSGRILVNRGDLDPNAPAALKDPITGQAFGVREIDVAIWKAARFQPSTALVPAAADLVVRKALGIPGDQDPVAALTNGTLTLPSWQVLVVQAGSVNGGLTYTASGDLADKSHVIVGGEGVDTLTGSTVKDYIIGGDGGDILMSGGGNDVIVGGIGEDRYIAKPLTVQLQGNVTFIGGPDKDTAVYGDEFEGYRLELVAKRVPVLAGQTVAEVHIGSTVVDTLIGVERIEFAKADDVAKYTAVAQKLGITLAMKLGSNEVYRIKDTAAAPELPEVTDKGAFMTVEFLTEGATGPQRQTLSTVSDFEEKERPNTIIKVNGHQLSGGASFDFDKFDLVSNGNVKPIYLMNSSQTYPAVATDDRVNVWYGGQVGVAVKYLTGLTGSAPGVNAVPMGPVVGASFAPIVFGALGKFAGSWNTGYNQTIIGVYGERYDLGSLAADGTRTLTITLNPLTDGYDQTIVINNWKQGDYGIRIQHFSYGRGLDSGTNKNGQLDSWQGVSLDTVRTRLAEIGIVAPPEANQNTARAMAGDDEEAPLVRAGNSEDNDLAGGGGKDLIRGYQGNDDLLGGEGRDTYVFAVGDGHDVIEDLSPEGAVIRFVDGLDVSSISKQQVAGDGGNYDLLVTYGDGDTILIKNWSTLSAEEQALWTFESVSGTFTPENSADEPDISVVPEEAGGTAATTITGTADADTLDGIDIDEDIYGLDGDDVINAGGGVDVVSGGEGNDILNGGAGNDTILGGGGNDWLNGGDGDDAILNDAGDDVITGGRGNDHIVIDNLINGNDTYIFDRGDGQDIIEAASNTDTLKLGSGILPSDIVIQRVVYNDPEAGNLYGDLVIKIAGTLDQITFRNASAYASFGDPFANADTIGPQQLVFDNGVVWSREDLLKFYIDHASTPGDDVILGSPNDEIMRGGAGNDIFHANSGNDGYVWNRGDGNDRITSSAFEKDGDLTRIAFGTGITASDVTFSMNAQGQLVVNVAGTNGGTITVDSYFAASESNLGLDRLAFTDGTVWTRTDIDQRYLAALSTGGDDVVIGTAGADTINGGMGNDTIIGNRGADVLDGGAGNDTLFGSGQVTYQFGASFGQDVVRDTTFIIPSYPTPDGDSHRDRLAFSSYNLADFSIAWSAPGTYDLILSRLGSTDKITIQNHRDLYDANLASIENFAFGDGTLLAFNQINAIANRAQTATNAVNGTTAAETLTGTTAADTITADAGADTVHGNDGDDLVNAGDGDDLVTGDAGNDILLGGAGIDTIGGGIGNDIIYAGTGNDVVTGDAGADILYGEGGNDQLNGGADNDRLYGHAGNDTLTGGTGDDALTGGAGNDTYVFNRGDGQDTIQAASERTLGEVETLVLGGGITQSDVHYALNGRDLVVGFTVNPADQITVKDFLGSGMLSSVVIDGVAVSATQILDALSGATSGTDNAGPTAASGGTSLVYGGRGNDTLTGDDQGNTYVFLKGDGQDRVTSPRPFFHSGSDDLVLNGYTPAEVVFSRAGAGGLDLGITFTSGTDRLDVTGQFGNGFQGIDTVQFEDGTVWSTADIRARVMSQAATSGNDTINGFDGSDDIVNGGAGNDALAGGSGNDRYSFSTGGGQDTLTDSGGSNDRLEFGTGIRTGNVAVTRSAVDANDAILTLSAGDIVTLKGVFSDATSGVDKVVFADGTVWSKTDLANAFLAAKTTTGADAITGTIFGETLAGGLGNDTLTGGAGGDSYLFNRGDGQDTIVELANNGNDRLVLGSGITTAQVTLREGSVDPTDLVVDIGGGETVTIKAQLAAGGTTGIESVTFADGTVWGRVDFDQKLMALAQTSGADTIKGSTVADRITGGTGNDTIDGRDGADVYVFNRGDGQDTIADSGTAVGLDRIEFGAGIGAADIDLARGTNPNDLVISIRGTTDKITVQNHFAGGGAKIGQVQLADGTVLFTADIAAAAGNHAPTVVTPVTTKTVAQNAAFNFVVPANMFADSDVGDTITLKATQVSGAALPAWLRFDGFAFSGTPANADVGTPVQVRLTAFDASGDSVNSDFTINVTNVNDAPILATLIPNRAATVGSAFSYQFAANQFIDPDNGLPGVTTQTLTYTAALGSGAALPSWLTFNAATRTFSGTPSTANRGPLDVVITASDGTASTTTHFGIFVGTTGNTAPTVGTAIGIQNATEDLAYSFQIPVNAFSDTAGDHLRYTAKLSSGAALPSWLTLDPVTGVFSGTPANANVAQLTVRVTATDIRGLTAAANFTLKVNNVNDAPVANDALESFVTNEDSVFSYAIPAGLFTDVDAGGALTLVAQMSDGSALPDWLVFNPATRTLSGTPDGKDVGMIAIRIVATDNSGASVYRDMFVLINGVNDAPVIMHALAGVAVDREDFFSFTVPSDTFADDGGGVSLTAQMADGAAFPSWLSFDPRTRTFSGTPDYGSVGDNEGVHVYRVALTATDAQGAATTTILNLAIRGPNPGTIVLGTEGSDSLTGALGPDILIGFGGNDTFQGREGPDTYFFSGGFGHDTITSRYATAPSVEVNAVGDAISFGVGIAASDVSVVLEDPFSNNGIRFDSSDPTLATDFYESDIILTVGSTGDSVRIQNQLANDRWDNFEHVIEQVRFADGTVWTAADLAARVATGGNGNDVLSGDNSGNVVSGGAGNDRLFAREGDDTLIGGTGNDDLYGEAGDDTYVFNLGDGDDRIIDSYSYIYGSNGVDTLRFGAGIRPVDLVFTRNTENPDVLVPPPQAGSLLVEIAGTSDSIRIYRQYAIRDDVSQGIDRFEFADGTVLNRAQIDQLVNPGNLIQGTDAAETLTGTANDERILGKKGDDLLMGNSGNDTYVWNVGDGNDTISEYSITSFDTVEFGIGISSQDFALSHIGPYGNEAAGYQLFMTYVPTGERLTINWEFDVTNTIDEFRFVDGTVWTPTSLIAGFLASTSGNDIIHGFPNRADLMDGGAGNDELHGHTGADIYVFGRGYGIDTIYDAFDGIFQNIVDRIQFNNTVSSTDIVLSRTSHLDVNNQRVIDTVFSIAGTTDKLVVAGAAYGFEAVAFTSITFGGDSGSWQGGSLGTRYLAQNSTNGNDTVIGFQANEVISTGLGDDTLDGGRGNDTLIGGAGNDTYAFWRAPETKIIQDGGLVEDVDTLHLANILAADVRVTRAANENDLIITTNDPSSDGTVVLQGRLIGAEYSADQIRFSDNSVWNYAAILSHAQAAAADAHLINGTAAAETITGTSLAETLDSKAGNDTIAGGFGDDIYIYHTGDGNDVINEVDSWNEIDTLKLRDLTPSQITLLKSGNNLVIHVNATGADITVTDQFSSSGTYGIEEIVFSDRTVWNRTAIGNRTSNQAPTNATLLGGGIEETTVNGTWVGTITGVDPDGTGTFTYSLIDNAGGRFGINATTGQITVANAALFNYESATSHNVTVRVTDPGDLSFDKTFSLAVYNINEAPTNATLVGGSIAENSANGAVVGTVTGVDPDAGAALTYSLTDNAGGRFAINSTTGQLTVANGTLLDYEAATSHGVTVRVVDQDGLSFDKTFTVPVTDVNEAGNQAPTNATLTGGTIAENSANGAVVGTVTGVDPDAGAVLTYALTDNAGGRFAINSTTGQITVANGTLLNYEGAASHGVTVRVTDQGGLTFDKALTLNLTNVNEAPGNSTLTGGTIAENTANGAVVGTVAGVDPDTGATLTYSLTDNAGGRFAVNSTTGQITVANGTLLNYESAATHDVTVRVTDQAGLTFDKAFTLNVTNVNEAPSNATLAGGTIAENSANGSVVGTVAGVDPDVGATLTYSLTDNAGGRFAVNATTGQITVANGTLLDFETATSHGVTVRVTDQAGLTFDKAFTIAVTDVADAVNNAPTNATLSGGSTVENAANGTSVGTVTGIDPDAGAVLSYSLTDNAGGRFAINATTGQITVANGTLLNYEGATSHGVTVRVTDQGGLTFDKAFTLNLTNVNETPTNATLTGGTIAENAANGAVVGTVTGVDPDAGATLTYSLTDNAGGRFAVNATTGQITVANGTLLNYESATTHDVTVRVTDQAGLTFDKVITLAVTNINETPTNATLTGGSIAENSANGAVVGTVAGVDPDAGSSLTYSLTDNAGGRFAVNSTTGQITVADGTLLNFESATSHGVTVRVTDQAGLTLDKAFALSVINDNEAPTDATLTGGTIAENSANGAVVGTVAGVDADAGSTLTYSLTDNAGGRFAVNSTTGQITVANGALLDFETATSHGVTVRVTDQAGLTFGKALTIAVTDVADAVNQAPTNATLTGGTIAENAANGAAVGTVAGVDPDAGATLTYSMTNDAGGRFAINSTSGQITVANGTLLNFESATSHGVTVRVTDQSGLTFDKAFTLGVTNVNEAPSNATLTGGSVAENAANGTVVGTIAGTDPDASATMTYSLTNNAGGRFAINSTTGQITVANGALLDYETATSHGVTVRVTDQGTLTFDKAFTLNLTNVAGSTQNGTSSANTLNGSAEEDILNGLGGNDTLNGLAGNDTLDGGTGNDTMAGGAGNDIYIVDSASDVVTEALNQGIDEVRTALASITLAANVENLTATTATALTGNGNGLDNIITGNSGNDVLFGGAGNDTLLGGVGDDVLQGEGGNDIFDGQGGTNWITTGTGLDTIIFKAGSGSLQVDDFSNSSDKIDMRGTGITLATAAQNITLTEFAEGGVLVQFGTSEVWLAGIMPGNITFADDFIFDPSAGNNAPTNATLSGGSIAENAANGTSVGTVTGVDPDAGAVLGYSLTDNAGGRFAINATTGQITVANGALLNYEAATSHGVTVRVTDQGGLTFDRVFTLNLTDVNEAPSNATLTGGSVAENSANGTVVGTVAGIDPDAGATFTYSLTDNAGGRFAINTSTGQISVANGTLLDYETATSYGVTVRTADQAGLTFDKAFAIAVIDVADTANNAPTNATLTGGTIAETATNGAVVGTVSGVDPDTGAILSYSLTDTAGGRFAINATSGQITVVNDALLDYEAATSHGVTVRVTDQGGLTFDKAFTLNLTNVFGSTLNGTSSANTLNGSSEEDILNGLGGNDTLNGLGGNDTLDGGTGNDTMAGGTGNDIYIVDSASDVVNEGLSEGVDEVRTSLASYTLGADVENVKATTAAALTASGNGLNNVITGNSGNDVLFGGAGNDTLLGGAGDDVLQGEDGNDIFDGQGGTNWITTGAGQDTLIFNAASGNLQVDDFTDGSDLIDMRGTGITAANAAQNITITEYTEGGVLVQFGTSEVWLEGIMPGHITFASDFLLN